MSLLSEYEDRTAWKYEALPGLLTTHPDLRHKVDDAGGYRPFAGSTVVFRLERREALWFRIARDLLYDSVGDMLAEALPSASFHMTLHDLVSPERTGVTPVFTDAARGSYAPQYIEEVSLSLGRAARIVEGIRREHSGRRIELLADRVVNMVSKSLVLMLKPATEADWALLTQLYRRFDAVVPLPYPLTPHVTLAYYRPGEHDGARLADFVKRIQVDARDPMSVSLCVEALTAQRFSDMQNYEDVPVRLCFCCDGGMNRSVMAAAVLNHRARERNLAVRADARAAFPNTEGRAVPGAILETLKRHGVPVGEVSTQVRYLGHGDRAVFSQFAAISGGALMRFAELGISPDDCEMAGEIFQNIRDPQYGADCDEVLRDISARVDRLLDRFADGHACQECP